MKIVKNLALVVFHCTFSIQHMKHKSMVKSMYKKMAAPPGQFIAVRAINVLKETISG